MPVRQYKVDWFPVSILVSTLVSPFGYLFLKNNEQSLNPHLKCNHTAKWGVFVKSPQLASWRRLGDHSECLSYTVRLSTAYPGFCPLIASTSFTGTEGVTIQYRHYTTRHNAKRWKAIIHFWKINRPVPNTSDPDVYRIRLFIILISSIRGTSCEGIW